MILHIILLILKIIGITIGCILGLVLLAVCAILFVPIRYRAHISYESKVLRYRVSGYWLLWLLNFKVTGEQLAARVSARIFRFTVFDTAKKDQHDKDTEERSEKKLKKSRKEKKKNTKQTESAERFPKDSVEKTAAKSEIISEIKKESSTEVLNLKDQTRLTDGDPEPKDKASEPGNKKPGLKEKILQLRDKICKKADDIRKKLLSICDKVKNINGKKEKLIEILSCKSGRAAIANVKRQLIRILKHLMFTKVRGRVHFGFEDPSLTGKILGMCGILYPLYGSDIVIEPEFSDQVLDGELELGGRIRIFSLLLPALKLALDKNLRKMIREIKHL